MPSPYYFHHLICHFSKVDQSDPPSLRKKSYRITDTFIVPESLFTRGDCDHIIIIINYLWCLVCVLGNRLNYIWCFVCLYNRLIWSFTCLREMFFWHLLFFGLSHVIFCAYQILFNCLHNLFFRALKATA